MRSFTVAERRTRLARRHFLHPQNAGTTIDCVVADLVGLRATDPATPYLSLWARLPGFRIADLDAELYERHALVKHLAMRRTLWMVRADDLPLIQFGASDRWPRTNDGGWSPTFRSAGSRWTATNGSTPPVRRC